MAAAAHQEGIPRSALNSPESALPLTVVRPGRRHAQFRLRELWDYRELLYFFTWRDLKVRYKQTVIGVAWAIVQPLGMMIVFTLVFGRIARLPSDKMAAPLFYFSGIVPWTYFSRAVTNATGSIIQNQHVVTKIYFPRMVLPISAVLACLVDLGIALILLGGMMAYFGVSPSPTLLLLPVFIAFAATTALALGLWLSALNAIYRDVGYAVAFFVQVGVFASPIAYPVSLVPASLRTAYLLNPMAEVIEGFRWALTGRGSSPSAITFASAGMVLLLLYGGLWFFRKIETTMVDVV